MEKNLTYEKALQALEFGLFMKLPEWYGYWFKGKDGNIQVMDRNGDVLDTPHLPYLDDYKNRTDWQETDGTRDYGGALALLRGGKKVARKGWGNKGMFVVYQKGYPHGIALNKNTSEALHQPENTIVGFRPYLMMALPQGSTMQFGNTDNDMDCVPWTASQTDQLADDWYMVTDDMQFIDQLSASEALYGFMAFLTCRKKVTTLSSSHTPGDLPERINEFCLRHKLPLPRSNYAKNLISPPKEDLQ